MSDYGVIRLSARGDIVDWVVAEAGGALRQAPQSGSLEAAAAALGERPVIVLVPAAEVLLTSVEIPARSPSKIRAALPFALEEELADDIDSLHFAIGAKHESGRIPVAVASRGAMDAWLERLAEADLKPQKIIAENQGLPCIPGTMSVLVDADTTMYNDGDELEFAIPYCKPSDVLVMAGAIDDAAPDDAQPAGHLIAFCDSQNDEKLSHDWIALRNELQSVDVKVMPHGALPKLAATVAAGHGINLLQGPYGKKTEYANLFRPWRIAAGLFLGLIVSSLLFKGASFYQMSRDEAALTRPVFQRISRNTAERFPRGTGPRFYGRIAAPQPRPDRSTAGVSAEFA